MRTTEIPIFDQLSDQERVTLADEILGSLTFKASWQGRLSLLEENSCR